MFASSILSGIASALSVALAHLLVEQRGILRRVDLHVLAPEAGAARRSPAREVDEIRKIRVTCRVAPFERSGRSRPPPAAR
jgi:hypothetical protein